MRIGPTVCSGAWGSLESFGGHATHSTCSESALRGIVFVVGKSIPVNRAGEEGVPSITGFVSGVRNRPATDVVIC